jgi:hypothetical protein
MWWMQFVALDLDGFAMIHAVIASAAKQSMVRQWIASLRSQ